MIFRVVSGIRPQQVEVNTNLFLIIISDPDKAHHEGQGHTHAWQYKEYKEQVRLTTVCKYELNTSISLDIVFAYRLK